MSAALVGIVLSCVAVGHVAAADPQSRAEQKELFRTFFGGHLDKKAEKKMARMMAAAITESAHPSDADPDLLKYKITKADRRIKVAMEVEYFGGLSGRKYPGTI